MGKIEQHSISVDSSVQSQEREPVPKVFDEADFDVSWMDQKLTRRELFRKARDRAQELSAAGLVGGVVLGVGLKDKLHSLPHSDKDNNLHPDNLLNDKQADATPMVERDVPSPQSLPVPPKPKNLK